MISVRHTNNRQSFKKVTCPFKSKVRKSKAIKIVYLGIIAVFSVKINWFWFRQQALINFHSYAVHSAPITGKYFQKNSFFPDKFILL